MNESMIDACIFVIKLPHGISDLDHMTHAISDYISPLSSIVLDTWAPFIQWFFKIFHDLRASSTARDQIAQEIERSFFYFVNKQPNVFF